MGYSRDDCRKGIVFGRQLFLGCTLLLLHAGFSLARADSWEQRAPVPGARAAHSAVWTGREMIVWGGGIDGQFLNTGGRYIPSTDTWRTTSPYGAPSPRWFHAAVWTGQEMIIWGGRESFSGDNNFNDGARYNPATDTWIQVNTEGAPAARSQCVAVWTGEEMIIWGGATEGGVPLNDGAAYNPATDQWRPINSASGLAPRMEPTAVWTGSEMIVFGGVDATQSGWISFGDGARYNPFTDSWAPLPAAGAPGSRTGHTAVWTGERMIVWGGRVLPSYSVLNDGAIYDPGTDAWAPIPFSYDAPQARMLHAAVWTGTEMIIWGGQADEAGTLLNTGARYNPATAIWAPTTQNNAPGKRMFWRPDLGIWTGRGMLVCAGSDYPASLDSTALYTVFDPPCPPVIREQPQSVTAIIGSSVTLAVGAGDCATAVRPTATQTSFGPYPQNFEFETGARSGQLQFDYDFFSIPDSLRVYYDGARIFDSNLSGQGTIRVPFGPGSATSLNIIVNEGGGPASTAWEYTVSYRPSPLHYHWRKDGAALEGETNSTLHFAAVSFADAGDYSVVVANNNSAVVSAVATLTVQSLPPTNCIPAPAGLVAWWPFDGNLKDAVSQSELMVVGEPSMVAGKAGQALRLDGNNDGVKASASAALNVGTNEGFSIELWVNPQNVTLQPLVVWSPHAGIGGPHFYLGGYGAGSIYANLVDVNGGQHSWRSDTGLVVVNEWQHVGMSYDKPSGLLRFYLNGQKVTEYELGSFTPLTVSDAEIGYSAPSGEYFTGLMDELSIYRRVLTDAEMTSIYNAGAMGKCGTNTPPPCAPPGLVAWWRGEGDARDVTGAHDGQLLFGTTFSPGVAGQAFSFDLSRARVSIPDDEAFKLTDSLSFEGWINVASYAPGLIFIRGDNRGGLDPYHMSMQPSGQLHWGINTASNSFAAVDSPGALATGVWTHVAAVLDGATGNMGLYVNGELVNQINTSLRPLRDLDPNSEPALGIGNHGGTFHHFPFHGSVDEWALYSRALSAAEIRGIYNAGAAGKCSITNPPPTPCASAPAGLVGWWRAEGNATDVEAHGDGAANGGVSYEPGIVGQAFRVDGVSGRISVPDADAFKLTEALSIEGWVKLINRDSGLSLFMRGDDRPGLDPYFIGVDQGRIVFGISDNVDADTVSVPFPMNQWKHVAATFEVSTGTLKLYLDGQLLAQGHTARRPARDLDPSLSPGIGIGNVNGSSVNFPWDGWIDEISLYNRALSDAEVLAIFHAGQNGKCATSPPPSAAVYDVSRDFSPTSNPTGAWSYGYSATLGGQFNLLTFAKTFGANNGVPISAWQVSDVLGPTVNRVMGNGVAVSEGGAFTAPSGTVYVWPGNDGSPGVFGIIRFTVPAGGGGVYRIASAARPTFDGPVSGDSDFHVLRNGQELFGQFLPPNTSTGWSNTLSLAAGESIDFVVGRGADGSPDHSSLKISAAIALLTNAPPPVRVYDVSEDFSPTSNPTGAWSYGYLATLGGSFRLLTFAKSYAANNGVPISAWQVTDSLSPSVHRVMGNGIAVSEGGAFTAPSGTVYVAPGNDGSPGEFGVIRFTVPAGGSGVYRIASGARSNVDGPLSGDSDFHVLKNGQELFGQPVPPNSATGWSNILSLAAGESIDFVVGRGADGSSDHSSLKVQAVITLVTNVAPPASHVFDLSGDFSLVANPNGPWSYGHFSGSVTGNFALLNTTRTFGAENGVPIDIWQLNNAKPWVAKVIGPGTAVSTHFNSAPGTIYFGPDPGAVPLDFAAIRFTVPSGAGGTYRLETAVRSLYDNTRSVDADFHVVKNGVQLFGRLVPANSGTGYSNTLTLAVGDRIDFVGGRGTNGLPDTGLKIQATLRAITLASMGADSVSFVAAGGLRVIGHAPHGMACHVERSTNLLDWGPAGPAVEVANGIFEFIDSQPPAGPACFYRFRASEP